MKLLGVYVAALLVLLVVLPWVMIGAETDFHSPASDSFDPLAETLPASLPFVSYSAWPAPDVSSKGGTADAEPTLLLWLSNEQRSETLSLEEYVARVTAAEMPVLFQEAALQAQAIAVRTYTLKRMQLQDKRSAHPGGDVCDQPGHCQAYASPQILQERWQQAYSSYWQRIHDAASSTAGLVLSYRGQLIDALYHSTCGGRTEYASEVWGGDPYTRPYLVSVPCSWDAESRRYQETVFISWQDLGSCLGLEDAAMQVAWTGNSAWRVEAVTAGGRIKEANLLGCSFSGPNLRSYLGLNSTQISVSQVSGGLNFQTTGYGHGVGLCQYGADGYAKAGANYIEILGHYYTGVTILPDYGR